jgi:hypothetical protein
MRVLVGLAWGDAVTITPGIAIARVARDAATCSFYDRVSFTTRLAVLVVVEAEFSCLLGQVCLAGLKRKLARLICPIGLGNYILVLFGGIGIRRLKSHVTHTGSSRQSANRTYCRTAKCGQHWFYQYPRWWLTSACDARR